MAAKQTEPIVYRYVGTGESLAGVPMHDLTQKQFDALSEEHQEQVRNHALYAAVVATEG